MGMPQPQDGDGVEPVGEALCLGDGPPDVGQALLQRLLVDALRVVGEIRIPEFSWFDFEVIGNHMLLFDIRGETARATVR